MMILELQTEVKAKSVKYISDEDYFYLLMWIIEKVVQFWIT